MKLLPLIKHEFKNMTLAVVMGLFILCFFQLTTVSNMYNSMLTEYLGNGNSRYYSYCGANLFEGVFLYNIIFAAVLVFLQFYGSKKDFMTSLPFTRKELFLSKNIVGWLIITAKNLIFFLSAAYMYSKAKPFIDNIYFYNPSVINCDLGSLKNIVFVILTCYISELAVYGFMFLCFSLARDTKLGIALILLTLGVFALSDSWFYLNFNGINPPPFITISNITEMYAVIILFFAVLLAAFTLLALRYYLNRQIEIGNSVFPYKFSRFYFIAAVTLAAAFAAGSFDLYTSGVRLIMSLIAAVIAAVITARIGKRRCAK